MQDPAIQKAIELGFVVASDNPWLMKDPKSGMIFHIGNSKNLYIYCRGSKGDTNTDFNYRENLTKDEQEEWIRKGFRVMNDEGIVHSEI
jgi:hypothetical protein